MNRLVLQFVSLLLVLGILYVSELAQVHSVEHVGHDTHHEAATHGTLLCSWMCAAGTVVDSVVVTVQPERSPIALTALSHSAQPSVETCQTSSSRAPPSFSL